MKRFNPWWTLCLTLPIAAMLLAACHDDTKKPSDNLSSGSITISADEAYKPVIEEELKVFNASNPDAHITVQYKPEADCFKDFLDKKSQLILVTRKLSNDEERYCEQNHIVPTALGVARDAIAVVVNTANPDTVFSRSQLEGILADEYAKKMTVVFDNSGSSTLRFMQDSILKSKALGKNVFAAGSSPAVIDYVAKNPNSIGFVGMTWVMDSSATDFTDPFIKNVRVAYLASDTGRHYSQPYQAYVANKRYPLTRTLYYIHSQTYLGLARGFANFLTEERGQLIFKTAQFLPLRTNIVLKDAQINTAPLQ